MSGTPDDPTRDRDSPSMSALLAFEATARLGSIARAGEERGTSHSAISRHIRALEESFGATLFERQSRGVVLTGKGRRYFVAIRSAVEAIRDAGRELGRRGVVLNVGCSMENFTHLLSPVFPALRRSLGDEARVRMTVYEYTDMPVLVPPDLDILFGWRDTPHPDPTAVALLCEEVVPVASPGFIRRWRNELTRPPREWHDVPRLFLTINFYPWMTWESWFEAQGCAPPDAPAAGCEHYFNLLAEAADGQGLAIGWNALLTDYLDRGRLVPVRDAWMPTDLVLYAAPTPTGATKEATKVCLAEMSRLIAGLRRPVITSPIRPLLRIGAAAAKLPKLIRQPCHSVSTQQYFRAIRFSLPARRRAAIRRLSSLRSRITVAERVGAMRRPTSGHPRERER